MASDIKGQGAFASTNYVVGNNNEGEDGDLKRGVEVLVESQLTVYGGHSKV